MQTPSAEVWPGFAATRQRATVMFGGGVRARMMAALLYLLGAVIAIVLLPLLVGLVLVCLALVGVARLRGLFARPAPAATMARDAEGRRNVRVRAPDA